MTRYTRSTCRKRLHGFTLIELLVVISIIALLIAILLPVLGAVRDSARATQSLSNTRQWGLGTTMSLQDYKQNLPWEGKKRPAAESFGASIWWANVVPEYVGQDSYTEIVFRNTLTNRNAARSALPMPPKESIFVDPSTIIPEDAPYSEQNPFWFFFSYVPNANLDNGTTRTASYRNPFTTATETVPVARVDDFAQPSITVLMFELRAADDEITDDTTALGSGLDRARGDWKHHAARHSGGGHSVYGDGHASFRSYKETIESEGVPGDTGNIRNEVIWTPYADPLFQ